MDQDSAQELEWADAGEAVLVRELTHQQQQMAEQLAADPGGLFGDEISDADRGFLERPEAVEAFRRIVPEQAAHGVFGWVDDTLAFAAPWGFAPQLIAIPVLLAFGRADVLVPPSHGEWLAANIPTAAVVVSELGGHLPGDPVAENRRQYGRIAGVRPLVLAWRCMLLTHSIARSILVDPCCPGSAGCVSVSREPTRTVTKTSLAASSQPVCRGAKMDPAAWSEAFPSAADPLSSSRMTEAIPLGHGRAGSGHG